MAHAPGGVALTMPIDTQQAAPPNCAHSGVRHQKRLVGWIGPLPQQVGLMTLSARRRCQRFFLDLSVCPQVANHIWRRFDPPLAIYDCQVKAAKTRAFWEQEQALKRSKSTRRRR